MAASTPEAHWPTPLEELVAVGRSPLGPPVQVDLPSVEGPFGELRALLQHTNGFTAFNAGIQVFRAGPQGLGTELVHWNSPETWKYTYSGLADGLLCFAQDLFGVQFAITQDHRVVAFDPETADMTDIGDSLDSWAQWLLNDPTVRGALPLATLWQDTNGPLDYNQRLLPHRLFVLGGSYDLDNLEAKDAAEAMRVRGPVAAQLHDAPDGSPVLLPGPQPQGDAPIMGATKLGEFDVFADYNMFFLLADSTQAPILRSALLDQLVADLIAARPGVVIIGTVRRMEVPVAVELRDDPPEDARDTSDHITEASITTSTGVVHVVGDASATEDAPRIRVPPGTYRVRVYSSGFDTLSADGLDGDDYYRLVLWPAPEELPRVVKRYPAELPGG